MVCIYCNSKTSVSNSRGSAKAHTTWRRRECSTCHSIFTTYERPDYTNALRVETRSDLEPFSRDRLFLSLHRALAHKKAATDVAGDLCDTIIQQLAHEHHNGLLTVAQITSVAHGVLLRYDSVAAGVYSARYIKNN